MTNNTTITTIITIKRHTALPIESKKVLVVIICVAEYKNKRILHPLPGAKTDKSRLLRIFKEKYKYDIITNKSCYVTNNDVNDILHKAKEAFQNENNGYDAGNVCYSGHGDGDNLLLSNFDITRASIIETSIMSTHIAKSIETTN